MEEVNKKISSGTAFFSSSFFRNKFAHNICIRVLSLTGIWENFGKPEAREMEEATPEYLKGTKSGQKFPGEYRALL